MQGWGSFLRSFGLSKGWCFRISVQRVSCFVHHQSTSPSMCLWETLAGQAHSRAHHRRYTVCPAPSQGSHRVKGLLCLFNNRQLDIFVKLRLQRCIGCMEKCCSIRQQSSATLDCYRRVIAVIVPSPGKKWAYQNPADTVPMSSVWSLRPVGATRSARVVTYRSTVGSLRMQGCWAVEGVGQTLVVEKISFGFTEFHCIGQ